MVRRIKEPSPNIMDLIHSGEVCLILNTPTKGRHSERDGFRLRREMCIRDRAPRRSPIV